MKGSINLYASIFIILLSFTGCLNPTPNKKVEQNILAYSEEEGPINKSSNDPRHFDVAVLDNHLQVVLVSDPRAQVSTASLVVMSGSVNDPADQLGLAHFVEHAVLLGSQKFPEPNGLHLFQRKHNGISNALTFPEYTEFFLSSSKENFTESLDMLGDAIAEPLFNVELAEAERNTIHAEWSVYRNNDLAVIKQINNVTYDPSNPRLRMGVGNLSTLGNKENSNLLLAAKNFHEQYYSAVNMRLTLVSSQPLSVLRFYAKTHFAKIRKGSESTISSSGAALEKQKPLGKALHYKPFSSIKRLDVDFPIINNADQWDQKSYEYLQSLFSSADKNTLLGQLQSQNIIDGASISYVPDLYGSHGFFRIDLGLTAAGLNRTDYALSAVFAYIDLVKRQGLEQWRYSEAKEIAAKYFERSINAPPLVLARDISSNGIKYPVKNLLDGPYIYSSLNRKFIQSTLDNWTPNNARVWYINQNERVDTSVPYFDGMYRIEDIAQDEAKTWIKQAEHIHLELPGKNDLANPPAQPLISSRNGSPQLLLSEPGIEAFLFQSQSLNSDSGTIVVELNNDINYSSDENFVMAELLHSMMELDVRFLTAKANKAYLSISSASGNENSLRYQVGGDTAYLDRLLVQVLQRFKDMSITEQDLDKHVRLLKANLGTNNGSLRLAFQKFQAGLLFNPQLNPDNYYKILDQITLEKMAIFQKSVKNTALVRLFISGNFSEERALNIARQIKQLFPGESSPKDRKIDSQLQIGKSNPSAVVKSRFSDNGVLALYLSEDVSIKERISIAILDKLLSPLFFNQIRTEAKLGYIVDSLPYTAGVNPGFEFFIQSPASKPELLQKAIERFLNDSLQKIESTSDDTIQALKSSNLNVFVPDGEHAYDFMRANYKFDQNALYFSALAEVDKNAIVATYKRLFLNPNKMSIMVAAENEK